MRLTRTALRSMIAEEIRRARLERLFEAEGDEEDSKDPPDDDSSATSLFDDPGDAAGGDSAPEPEDTGDEGGSDDSGGDTEDTKEGDSESDEDMVPADEAKEDAEAAAEEARKEGALAAMGLQTTITGPLTREVQSALNAAKQSANIPGNIAKQTNKSLVKISDGKSRGILSRLIFESQEELQIDLPLYTQRIANLITNYDNILDIEKAIFDAAYTLLSDDENIGPDVADEFKNILARDYDLEFDHVYDPEKADQTFYGVGSKKPEGA